MHLRLGYLVVNPADTYLCLACIMQQLQQCQVLHPHAPQLQPAEQL